MRAQFRNCAPARRVATGRSGGRRGRCDTETRFSACGPTGGCIRPPARFSVIGIACQFLEIIRLIPGECKPGWWECHPYFRLTPRDMPKFIGLLFTDTLRHSCAIAAPLASPGRRRNPRCPALIRPHCHAAERKNGCNVAMAVELENAGWLGLIRKGVFSTGKIRGMPDRQEATVRRAEGGIGNDLVEAVPVSLH